MNPLKKIYCRTFQTGLKIALPFLPYRKPKIVGSVKALPEVIQKKKCSKVLIITDAGIRKLGLTRRLEKTLENAGIPFCIYDKTVANPTTDNVSEAVDIYMKEGCDCIIGFGGGSSMDCAKAAGACIVKPKQSPAVYHRDHRHGCPDSCCRGLHRQFDHLRNAQRRIACREADL